MFQNIREVPSGMITWKIQEGDNKKTELINWVVSRPERIMGLQGTRRDHYERND